MPSVDNSTSSNDSALASDILDLQSYTTQQLLFIIWKNCSQLIYRCIRQSYKATNVKINAKLENTGSRIDMQTHAGNGRR